MPKDKKERQPDEVFFFKTDPSKQNLKAKHHYII